MRHHESCPKCGFTEGSNWRPRFQDTEMDYIEAAEIPELAAKMKPGDIVEGDQWVYYRTKKGTMIYRMLKFIFTARAGKFRRGGNWGMREGGAAVMFRAFNRNLAAKKKQTKLFAADKSMGMG